MKIAVGVCIVGIYICAVGFSVFPCPVNQVVVHGFHVPAMRRGNVSFNGAEINIAVDDVLPAGCWCTIDNRQWLVMFVVPVVKLESVDMIAVQAGNHILNLRVA